MHKFVLTDPQDFTGTWHLPAKTAEGGTSTEPFPVSGTLRWAKGEARLALDGMLAAASSEQSSKFPVVHGTTRKAELVTLLRSIEVHSSSNWGPAGQKQTQELLSHTAVVGGHVDGDQLYESLTARIPGLEDWLGGIGTTFTRSASSVTLEIPGRTAEDVHIPSTGIELEFSVGRSHHALSSSEVRFTFPGYLTVRPDQPARLSDLLAHLYKVRALLSILVASPMFPDWITVQLPGNERASDLNILVGLWDAELCRHKSQHDHFLPRALLGESLSTVLNTWFEVFEQIASPVSLAQDVLNSTGLWNHVLFLSHMQVLEGLHRARGNGLYMDQEEYDKIAGHLAGQIPKSVDPNHRTALKSRLQFGNEISLRNRLKALVAGLPEEIRQLVLNADSIPGSWVTTRNFYTHWDQASHHLVLKDIEIHAANVKLGMLIRVLLLQVAGVPQAAVLAALNGNSKTAQEVHQSRGW